MAPAQERLDADHTIGGHIELGLVEHLELITPDGIVKRRFEFEAPDGIRIHLRAVQPDLTPSETLRLVHGRIGASEQLFRVLAVDGKVSDTDARRHVQQPNAKGRRFERERLREGIDDLFGDHHRSVVADVRLEEYAEFVAAQAGHVDAHLLERRQSEGDGDEELVAGAVAETVVHELETVEIEEHHRHRPAAQSGLGHRLFEATPKGAAVRQPRQVIVLHPVVGPLQVAKYEGQCARHEDREQPRPDRDRANRKAQFECQVESGQHRTNQKCHDEDRGQNRAAPDRRCNRGPRTRSVGTERGPRRPTAQRSPTRGPATMTSGRWNAVARTRAAAG